MHLEFPGRERLIAALDAAVALGEDRAITDALRKSLCELMDDAAVALPAAVMEPVDDHYARRELHASREHGYAVIAMTWAPGQGTMIHDHCGMWCVEGVWRGRLEITQYELAEQDDPRYRFVPVGTIEARTGSAGSLIPPHEYHTICNADPAGIAVSVHVYQGPLESCACFCPQEDGWFVRESTQLAIDEAP